MDLEITLKAMEECANILAKRWRCVYCQENKLIYLKPTEEQLAAEAFDYGIEYKCESCGAVNKFDEVRNYAGDKRS